MAVLSDNFLESNFRKLLITDGTFMKLSILFLIVNPRRPSLTTYLRRNIYVGNNSEDQKNGDTKIWGFCNDIKC